MSLAELLEPISAEQPAGEDPQSSVELSQIIQMRRAPVQGGLGATSDTRETDWAGIAKATSALLKEKSKDLRVACWWTEAQMSVAGLDGLCEGLELLNGLVREFWHRGLHPSEDVEQRVELLEWLDRKLEKSLPGILLAKTDLGSLTWGDALGSQSQIDSGKSNELVRLVWRVEAARYAHQAERAAAAAKLISDLETALSGLQTPISFGRTLGQLANIQRFAARWHNSSRPESAFENPPEGPVIEPPLPDIPKVSNPWSECIGLLRAGRFSDAEIWMTRALQTDCSPRDIFLRKLETASAFLEKERFSVARGILIGLMEQAELMKLEHWESPDLLARMWSLLYQSCQQAEDSALREKAYNGLCKLAPWAALNLQRVGEDGG
jgi:hypothetical protein